MDFTITLFNVLILIFYAVPGFLLAKFKLLDEKQLKGFATILIYVLAPAMVLYTFNDVTYSTQLLKNIGMFALFTLVAQGLFILIMYLLVLRRSESSTVRIVSIASVFGNVGFFGLPILNALLPGNSEILIYSVVFVSTMNILAFTIGQFALTNDKRYMSLKKAILNPATIALIISIILLYFDIKFPDLLANSVTLLGQMSTPLCMLILGVRLAYANLRNVFLNKYAYFASILKLVIFPLFAYALVYFLPVDDAFKTSVLILCATPIASIVLTLSEIADAEQEFSANILLISTLFCIITMPTLLLII